MEREVETLETKQKDETEERMKELQEERAKASDELRKNLRRNTLDKAHRKLGGSVELQILAVAWGRGLVADLHKELWTPEKN